MTSIDIKERIPLDGLRATLSVWSGRGVLKTLENLPPGPDVEMSWSKGDVRRRAARVLIERLITMPTQAPLIPRLPKRGRDWQDAIPAAIHTYMWQDETPKHGVSWVQTFVKFGWPPKNFVGKSRQRTSDLQLLSTASWVAYRVIELVEEATRLFPDVADSVRHEVDALVEFIDLVGMPPFPLGAPHPSKEELTNLKSEGYPWGVLASIAQEIIRFEVDPVACAFDLIVPDNTLSWRLYHLSVTGLVLIALRNLGAYVDSLRPVGDWGSGPAYKASYNGRILDIWFEASGIWNRERKTSPYAEASVGVANTRSLGADILLCDKSSVALALECKFYAGNGEGAARDGFLQATTYSSELRAKLFDKVWSCVVMPNDQVSQPGWTTLPSGPVGIISHGELGETLKRFLEESSTQS